MQTADGAYVGIEIGYQPVRNKVVGRCPRPVRHPGLVPDAAALLSSLLSEALLLAKGQHRLVEASVALAKTEFDAVGPCRVVAVLLYFAAVLMAVYVRVRS